MYDPAFNVGATVENYQVKDIADLVVAAVPGSSVVYAEGGGPGIRSYRVEFSKLASSLPGARPVWSLQAGIDELLAAYHEGA